MTLVLKCDRSRCETPFKKVHRYDLGPYGTDLCSHHYELADKRQPKGYPIERKK